MFDGDSQKKKKPRQKGVDKEEKLMQRKIKAAEKFNTPPPTFCLATKE